MSLDGVSLAALIALAAISGSLGSLVAVALARAAGDKDALMEAFNRGYSAGKADEREHLYLMGVDVDALIRNKEAV